MVCSNRNSAGTKVMVIFNVCKSGSRLLYRICVSCRPLSLNVIGWLLSEVVVFGFAA